MDLPDKLFYSLEELVRYGWRGVTSVEEILHAAAVGKIPIHVRVESDCFCYRRTVQQYFKRWLAFTDQFVKNPNNFSSDEYHKVFEFKHDYSSLFAQVPHTILIKMVFNGVSEVNSNFLIEHSLEKSIYGLLEAKEYDDIAIVSFDPKRDCFPNDIILHQNDFVILRTTVLDVELNDINERINETKELDKRTRNGKVNDNRYERNNLKLIAALKDIILEKTELKSQADIIDFINNDPRFKHISGLQERTIQDRFSQANTALKDAGD